MLFFRPYIKSDTICNHLCNVCTNGNRLCWGATCQGYYRRATKNVNAMRVFHSVGAPSLIFFELSMPLKTHPRIFFYDWVIGRCDTSTCFSGLQSVRLWRWWCWGY